MERKLSAYPMLEHVLGSTPQPNMAVPSWFKEGVAVELETRLTGIGRSHGAFYDMYIRQAVADGALFSKDFATLDTINSHFSPKWPWTLRAYLFGTLLVGAMDKDSKKSKELIDTVASSVPFQFETNFREVMGISLKEFWLALRQNLKTTFDKKIKALTVTPLTPIKYLTNTGYYKNGLSLSPNQKWLVTTEVRPDEDGKISLIDLSIDGSDFNSKNRLVDRTSGSKISFSKTSRFIAFDDVQRSDRYKTSSDIFVFDLKTRRYVEASPNFGAKDPDIHPDGKHLVFVVNQQGRDILMSSDTSWENLKVLYDPASWSRISLPQYNHDGSKVVFSIHNDKTGGEDLVLLTAEGLKVLVANAKLNFNPSWIGDRDSLLFASNMKDDVFNIYKMDIATSQVYKLTNTIGGFFYPVSDKDYKRIFFVSYRSNGYDVATAKIDDLSNVPIAPRELITSRHFSYVIPQELETQEPPPQVSTSNYFGLKYLLPQYIVPSIRILPFSNQFGATIGAIDPLYMQHYEITIRHDFSSNLPVGRFYYYNGTQTIFWDLEFNRQAFKRRDSETGEVVLNKKIDGQIGASVPLNLIDFNLALRPHMDLNFSQAEEKHLHYGYGASIYYDTEFKQIGESLAQSGSFFEVGRTDFNPQYEDDEKYSLINARARHHFKLYSNTAYHVSWDTLLYRSQQRDDAGGFGVGSQYSFPLTWSSDLNLYGYRPNEFRTKTAHLFTHRLTTKLKDIDYLLSLNLPIYLEQLSMGVLNQFAQIDVDETRLYPWSLGLELFQDITVGHIFQFKVILGYYTGPRRLGGRDQVIFSIESSL